MKKSLPPKKIIDATFIVLALIFLIIANELNWNKLYFGFALLPLIIAYYAGQYVQKRSSKKSD